jgi:hypothetical protein
MAKPPKNTKESKPLTYAQKRMQQIGLTPELNTVEIFNPEAEWPARDTYEIELIQEDERGLRIPVYTLDSGLITYWKTPENTKSGSLNAKIRTYYVTRLETPIQDAKGKEVKYLLPGKKEVGEDFGTVPWLSPNILKNFDAKQRIETLYITEGYLKAICGYVNGFYIVGLSSITHYRDKKTKTIHPDIIRIIKECKVSNVVLLHDGDCLDISMNALKDGEDLYKRPHRFFMSVYNVKELLKDAIKDYDFDFYYAHVNSKVNQELSPKGLDDLFTMPDANKEAIYKEAHTFSGVANHYFHKINLTVNMAHLSRYFKINSPEAFYTEHQPKIGNTEFLFNGTKFKWTDEKGGKLEVLIPGEAKNYFRVGDDYYKTFGRPNKYGDVEHIYRKRSKKTIEDDHGKTFCKHVSKYEAFVNVPDNVNFQQVIHNCYNVYERLEHSPEDGECEQSLNFVRHIFQEHYELGLDYLQLIFTKPTQILPILCLVSRENSTGKTTFAKWLKAIFSNNMCIIGNAELESEFNASYATKLLVCCDEAFISKKLVTERIKSLSTAEKITMNRKGKDHEEIDFFGKFILLTNNEDNFINASDDDIRYWVRKVPVINKDNMINIMPLLIDEIPAFLNYLNKRQLHSPGKHPRQYFTLEEIETDALKKVIQQSASSLEKNLRKKIIEYMLDFNLQVFYMTTQQITEIFGFSKQLDDDYIERTLKEKLGVDRYKTPDGKYAVKRYYTYRYEYTKQETEMGSNEWVNVGKIEKTEHTKRPFEFKREHFITEEMLKEMQFEDDNTTQFKIDFKPKSEDDLPF